MNELKVLTIKKRHTARINYEGVTSSDTYDSYEAESILYIDKLLGFTRRSLGSEVKKYFSSTDSMESWIKRIMNEIGELKEIPHTYTSDDTLSVNVILEDLSWAQENLRFVIEERYSDDSLESDLFIVTYEMVYTDIEVD